MYTCFAGDFRLAFRISAKRKNIIYTYVFIYTDVYICIYLYLFNYICILLLYICILLYYFLCSGSVYIVCNYHLLMSNISKIKICFLNIHGGWSAACAQRIRNLYIYIYIYKEREREGERYRDIDIDICI